MLQRDLKKEVKKEGKGHKKFSSSYFSLPVDLSKGQSDTNRPQTNNKEQIRGQMDNLLPPDKRRNNLEKRVI